MILLDDNDNVKIPHLDQWTREQTQSKWWRYAKSYTFDRCGYLLHLFWLFKAGNSFRMPTAVHNVQRWRRSDEKLCWNVHAIDVNVNWNKFLNLNLWNERIHLLAHTVSHNHVSMQSTLISKRCLNSIVNMLHSFRNDKWLRSVYCTAFNFIKTEMFGILHNCVERMPGQLVYCIDLFRFISHYVRLTDEIFLSMVNDFTHMYNHAEHYHSWLDLKRWINNKEEHGKRTTTANEDKKQKYLNEEERAEEKS